MRVADDVRFEGISELFRGQTIGVVLTEEDVAAEFGSLRKSVKRVGKTIKKVAKKVGRPIVRASKKVLLKYGPYLAVAAQLLNFIPGLGVAVGAAIQVGHMALKAREAKKDASAAKAADKAQEAADQAEQAARDKEAAEAADAAYIKGEQYFVSKYGMTRDRWATLSPEDKLKFMNVTVYDLNADAFTKMGWPRERFMSLSAGQQAETLDQLVGALQAAGGDVSKVSEGRVVTSGKLAAVKTALPWVFVAGGAILLVAAGYILYTRKRKE